MKLKKNDFEFNQDIEFDNEMRSPGWLRYQKKIKVIKKIKKFIKRNELDGYIIPKNDNYFTEYSNINNLSKVSNFTGSAGFALILKNKNYLFVDGRYTLQAKKEAGKKFKILEIPYKWPKDLVDVKIKKLVSIPNYLQKIF